MIFIKESKKDSLLFKAGSKFEAIRSIPDRIQVNVAIQKGFILIGLNFHQLLRPYQAAIKYEPAMFDKKGKEIKPEVQGRSEREAEWNVPTSVYIEHVPDNNFHKFSLLDAHKVAVKQLTENIEKGYECKFEITKFV